jgi:hypothetical protein
VARIFLRGQPIKATLRLTLNSLFEEPHSARLAAQRCSDRGAGNSRLTSL